MEPAKKKKLSEKYKTMSTAKKHKLLSKKAEKYKKMDGRKKKELLNNIRERKKQNYFANKNKDPLSCIEKFKKKIREGPYYIIMLCV